MTATSPPLLGAHLEAGLKRVRLAAIRRLALELLLTARTQRWRREKLLRTLVDVEIAAHEASNTASRRKTAGFPVEKNLEEFDVAVSSIPTATVDYLASLDGSAAARTSPRPGPRAPASPTCWSRAHAAAEAGHRAR